MKIILQRQYEQSDDIIINDIKIIDILVEDGEADVIIIDDFINQFTYLDAGNVLNKIISKLKVGGEIIVLQPEIEVAAQRLSCGQINIETFNNLMFTGPNNNFLPIEIVENLLQNANIKITFKNINELYIATVKGIRNV